MGKDKKILTVEELLASCVVKEELIDILGVGSIKIRGLTKEVQQQARGKALVNNQFDGSQMEIELFKAGVVEPVLNDEQIITLKQSMLAGTFDKIIKRISEISGVLEEEEKDVNKFFRAE